MHAPTLLAIVLTPLVLAHGTGVDRRAFNRRDLGTLDGKPEPPLCFCVFKNEDEQGVFADHDDDATRAVCSKHYQEAEAKTNNGQLNCYSEDEMGPGAVETFGGYCRQLGTAKQDIGATCCPKGTPGQENNDGCVLKVHDPKPKKQPKKHT